MLNCPVTVPRCTFKQDHLRAPDERAHDIITRDYFMFSLRTTILRYAIENTFSKSGKLKAILLRIKQFKY